MPLAGRLESTPLLDVIQIISYSQQSGSLHVRGANVNGVVVFERGAVICANSRSALSLLVKAAKERDPTARLSLRRIQALVSLRELLDINEGDFRFERLDEPVEALEGLDISSFYVGGALDTGDLLLVLERATEDQPHRVNLVPASEIESSAVPREEPRCGRVTIPATLRFEGRSVEGYLTNLSRGGTFLHADEFPEPDCECELDFELPWGLGHCGAKVQVEWLRPEDPVTRQGAGLSFLAFSPDSKERITAYLERFRALAVDVNIEA